MTGLSPTISYEIAVESLNDAQARIIRTKFYETGGCVVKSIEL